MRHDDDDDRHRREWRRLSEDDAREVRGASRPWPRGGGRGDFEREYGAGGGSQGHGGRDLAHTGSFTGSSADLGEPSDRHRSNGPDYGSGDRGWVSEERTRRSAGRADGYGRRTRFEEEPASFGMGMMGNFGFDRGGEGLGSGYFGGSDRGRQPNANYTSRHGGMGGDVDRGFAGNSAAGGTDRGYSGGLNYGWGGNAHRGGMAHDRFEDVRPELRQQEQTVRGHRGVGPRNFRRNDERIRHLVSERLEDHDDIDASNIEVSVENAVVRLTGTVPDRRMKRLAEDVADSVGGVEDVENQLRIGAAT